MIEPAKFLCICEGGVNRSGGMAWVLKGYCEKDALAASWRFNSRETLEALISWADRVVVMEASFADKLPLAAKIKLVVVDVGPDRFQYPLNPELQKICAHAIDRWIVADWRVGEVFDYRKGFPAEEAAT